MSQFAVIGMGKFGSSVAKTLVDMGQQVLAIDVKEELAQEASEYATHAICIDATDEKALKSVGAADMDVAIVSIGDNLAASVLVTLALKEMGIKRIVAKAMTQNQAKALSKVGATQIVLPEIDMGQKLARSLILPDVVEQINLSADCSIFETTAPPEFLGKTLEQLKLRAKYGVNVIAVKRQEKLNTAPKAEDKIQEGDSLIMVGPHKAIKKFKKE